MKLETRVRVPEKLRKYLRNPTPAITKTLKLADKKALKFLQGEISRAAPRKTGQLARSIQVDLPRRKVFSTLPWARAVELGHYAVPENTPKRMFLSFTSRGKDVFLKFVRTKKQPFFFLTLSRNQLKVIKIYDKAFKKLLESL